MAFSPVEAYNRMAQEQQYAREMFEREQKRLQHCEAAMREMDAKRQYLPEVKPPAESLRDQSLNEAFRRMYGGNLRDNPSPTPDLRVLLCQ